MANPEHVAIRERGVEEWNRWREDDPETRPDLHRANLRRARLQGANLSCANLGWANLTEANLRGAELSDADLTHAKLIGARLYKANLRGAYLAGAFLQEARFGGRGEWEAPADLTEANLRGAMLQRAFLSKVSLRGADLRDAGLGRAFLGRADLYKANLHRAGLGGAILDGADLRAAWLGEASLRGASLRSAQLEGAHLSEANLDGADLSEAVLERARLVNANLRRTTLVDTRLRGSDLSGAAIYGASVWDVQFDEETRQTDMVITPDGGPSITVDNLEVAQFIYLMLHNEKIRGVIDTIGKKGVLILGRFYEERKAVLDAIKARLRQLDHVPVVFDWDKPTTRDLTETVQLLANLSRFVVADVTDAKSIPQELSHIVPSLPSVPVRPIILAGDREYSMFEHWENYNTVLPVFEYDDQDHLIDNIEAALIEPVVQWEAGYDQTKALREEAKAQQEEIARLRAEVEALKSNS